jgi:hypothetical protein
MVKSSVGGATTEGEGLAGERAAAGNETADNSSREGKLIATASHTSPSPRTVIAPAMIPLEDSG